MVTMIARPEVADFLDEVAHVGSEELLLEQMELAPTSPLVGQTIAQAALSEHFGVTILACRTANHPTRRAPSADTRLEAGMQILALGTQEQLQVVLKLAGGKKS
jgi:voltage-gated potassium channel